MLNHAALGQSCVLLPLDLGDSAAEMFAEAGHAHANARHAKLAVMKAMPHGGPWELAVGVLLAQEILLLAVSA